MSIILNIDRHVGYVCVGLPAVTPNSNQTYFTSTCLPQQLRSIYSNLWQIWKCTENLILWFHIFIFNNMFVVDCQQLPLAYPNLVFNQFIINEFHHLMTITNNSTSLDFGGGAPPLLPRPTYHHGNNISQPHSNVYKHLILICCMRKLDDSYHDS